ncbi:hypothetical protein M409DRAFT_70717 [Zasmidium cellare ATCC 36951]|uniref:Alcohol dehydrogenase-like N-terminal domain-containing protein n=1 Tax=Zasmidium cellare ATCC 36951 TaxID=1080233 RepID=A0A6A6C156_ZASCE|nr:uncharacterized protein M409DRAFT_70717 [Zasmidium cellare ATCC 36951]KAF2159998.1 hypothetical protein M409DRAFT_70717 [Zasmidium cellare ATCC 36951]
MPQNQAAWLHAATQPLQVGEIPMPKAAPGRLIVRNHAVAANPADWKIQEFGVVFKTWPNVLGADLAGEVVEVGEGVEGFEDGDRVFAHAVSFMTSDPSDGGFALYTSVLATATAKIPLSISYSQAAVLPLAVDTAAVGLYSPAEGGYFGLPYPTLTPSSIGKTLIVWGGSSSVGAVTTQLATASGVKVVAIASKKNCELCEKAGAVKVLDYNNPSIVEDAIVAVKDVGGTLIGIYDAVSIPESSYKRALAILERLGGGTLTVVFTPPESVPASVRVGAIQGFGPVTHPIWREYLTAALESGKLLCLPEPWVIGQGLKSIQKALDENKKGVSGKKVVLEL